MNDIHSRSVEDPWKRALYIVLFLMINGFILKSVVFVTAVVQFAHVIIKGETNTYLAGFNEGLSNYSYRLTRYVTCLTDQKPFPFSTWDNTKIEP